MYTKEEQKSKTSYSFWLQALAGLAGVVLTAGVITAIALKMSTTASTASVSLGLATGALTAGAFPIIPVVAISAIILALCILPLVFCCNSSTYAASSSAAGYSSTFWSSPSIGTTHHYHGGSYGGSHSHAHSHVPSHGNHHGHNNHSSSHNTHTHSSPSPFGGNRHGHGH